LIISTKVSIIGWSMLGIGWILLINDFLTETSSIASLIIFASAITLFAMNFLVMGFENKQGVVQ